MKSISARGHRSAGWPSDSKKYRFNIKCLLEKVAYRYRIDPALGLLVEKFVGEIGWRDLFEGASKSATDSNFRPGMNVLMDLTDAHMDIGYKEMRALIAVLANAPDHRLGRVAVVAPEPLQFGLSRMYQAIAEGVGIYEDCRVFSEFIEARTWLGLPEDTELRA